MSLRQHPPGGLVRQNVRKSVLRLPQKGQRPLSAPTATLDKSYPRMSFSRDEDNFLMGFENCRNWDFTRRGPCANMGPQMSGVSLVFQLLLSFRFFTRKSDFLPSCRPATAHGSQALRTCGPETRELTPKCCRPKPLGRRATAHTRRTKSHAIVATAQDRATARTRRGSAQGNRAET